MNSALQCLAHLPELTDYFTSTSSPPFPSLLSNPFTAGLFKRELNPDNPLSTGGDLARAYGLLLSTIFEPDQAQHSIAPRELKLKISKYAPSFSGYAQHDTQELLAFLLDGMHEDLNRIVKKPYVENPDWNGGGDEELVKLAREYWTGYKKRNDSVIVDLFQGQYKSTLVCPECSKVRSPLLWAVAMGADDGDRSRSRSIRSCTSLCLCRTTKLGSTNCTLSLGMSTSQIIRWDLRW